MVIKNTQVGALWRNKDKNGNTFFSGNISMIAGQETKIMVFPFKAFTEAQKKAENDGKAPAYVIVLAQNQEEKGIDKKD